MFIKRLIRQRHFFTTLQQYRREVQQNIKLIEQEIQVKQSMTKLKMFSDFSYKLNNLIKADISSKPAYSQYSFVLNSFQILSKNLTIANSSKWNVDGIKKTSQLLSNLYKSLSEYPSLELKDNTIFQNHKLFTKALNLKSQQELNNALLFTLKADSNAQQSHQFAEFIKFYLRSKSEYLKIKYQVHLKEQTISTFIRKITAKIVQRGFLRRTPDYDRTLSILYPTQTILFLFQNQSTRNSLIIGKIFYYHIFLKIQQFYDQIMFSNIYNTQKKGKQGKTLWEIMNNKQLCRILFNTNHRSQIIQQQAQYLRELFVTLFLVLYQQDKKSQILDQLLNLSRTYQWLVKNKFPQQSLKSKQFVNKLQQIIQTQCTTTSNIQNLNNLQLCEELFILGRQFNIFHSVICSTAYQNLTALTFRVYLTEIKYLLNNYQAQSCSVILQKLYEQKKQQNYFVGICLKQCLQFVKFLYKNQEKFNKNRVSQVYSEIVEGIINKSYELICLGQVIQILQIYAYHKYFILPKQSSDNVKIIWVFLMRYIADNHRSHKNLRQFQKLLKLLIIIDDQQLFNDEENNYPNTIYKQLQIYLHQFDKQKFSINFLTISQQLQKMIKWINVKYLSNGQQSQIYHIEQLQLKLIE